MNKSLASALILGGACALTTSLNALTINLVNDTFTGGTGADTTTYPRWSADGITDLVYSQPTDAFRVTTTGTSNGDRSFVRSFSEVTLGASESLSLTFDFTPGAGNSIYRFALSDFGSTTVTDGSLGTTPAITKDSYYSMFGSATFGAAVRRETIASGTIMGGGTSLSTAPLNAPTTTFATTTVSVIFTLTNTGTSVAPVISFTSELHAGSGGTGSIIYSMTGSQTTGALNKFDNIVLLNGGSVITLDNVKLDYITTASIPEPGTAAAGMGAVAALAALALRRRRAA